MKKYLCILLVLVMVLTFAGCGDQNADKELSARELSTKESESSGFAPWDWAANLEKNSLDAIWTQTYIQSTTKETGENQTKTTRAQGGGLLDLETEEPDEIIALMRNLKEEEFHAVEPENTTFGFLCISTQPNIPCNVVAFFDEENSAVVLVRQEQDSLDLYYTDEYDHVKNDEQEYIPYAHWQIQNPDLMNGILALQAVPENWPYN